MDSWKGSLSALEACEAVARGIRSVVPNAACVYSPLADGGEGTQELVAVLRPGRKVVKTVHGPLPGQQIEDGYLLWSDTHEALIEMARCAGLPLLKESEKNPLQTTTYGVGEWMQDAVERGCTQFTLAVGGSATVDGGVGMAQAMGWHFLNSEGKELEFGGEALRTLDKIIPPESLPELHVRVMCDVTNPLLGEQGSAAIFGPQKGASPEQVSILEAALTRLAEVIHKDLGVDVRHLPGGGAAGGIAAGAVAFLGAELVSGVDEMMRITDLNSKLQAADWVITGEGRVDSQSLEGKVLSGVLDAVKGSSAQVVVIAGSCDLGDEDLKKAGLLSAFSANDQELPLVEALTRASELAEAAGRRFAKMYLG